MDRLSRVLPRTEMGLEGLSRRGDSLEASAFHLAADNGWA